MKRILSGIVLAVLLFSTKVKADEGMWLLPLIQELNQATMQEMGLDLTAEQIYSINNSSLKDAIVIFGGGCTGEIVSDQGLLFTNHHCGYDEIQNHSTVEHDYLKEGFWAMSHDEELPNPNLSVTFLIRVEDVTEQILVELSDEMAEEDRLNKIEELCDTIASEATEGTHYDAVVESFFSNNKYYLFVYEEYNDVRLVGAPPSSIGKYGYDTDNWMWPRHTGDFSIFRVYTAPDGSPAEYAEENIPMKPKHHLPVSLAGVEKGDFTMVLGYPGGTDRYMSSFGVKETMEIINPNRVRIRGIKQEIMHGYMQSDPALNIMYASKYSRSTNYWKFSIGQNKGLKRLKVMETKQAEEKKFSEWVAADVERKEKFGEVLTGLEKGFNQRGPWLNNLQYIMECFPRAIDFVDLGFEFLSLQRMLESEESEEDVEEEVERLKEYVVEHFGEVNTETDKAVAKAMIATYMSDIKATQQPAFCQTVEKKYSNSSSKYVDHLFKNSMLTDQVRLEAFLSNPSAKKLSKDAGMQMVNSIMQKYRASYSEFEKANIQIQLNERLYMEGRMAMDQDHTFYPDANFTMRLTYGTVLDYSPADAVQYNYLTTLKGVMEKEDPDNYEFEVSGKLKELFDSKDYGDYGMEDVMPVCFTTTNDITGGNSGSPVINGKGELIGLAFDGNWEAMSGDIVFEPELQRCICVDVRYVLFVIDKYAEASHLIDELTIVK